MLNKCNSFWRVEMKIKREFAHDDGDYDSGSSDGDKGGGTGGH